MKVLVTGSEGYIGAVVTPLLIKSGYDVVGLDTNFYHNSRTRLPSKKYTLIKKDIRDIKNIDLSGYDAIIHLAALSNDPTGALDPNLTLDINYKSTIQLAKKAKKQKVKRFLFASSCSIYGITKSDTVNEKSKTNPLTAYAKSKILSEKSLQKLADKNFCVGLLRNSTVYGYSPVLRDDLVVNNFAACALTTNTVKIKSDGSPWRPLIDIRDLSMIFIEFLKADKKLINGKIFNIGFNENNFQVKNILEMIQTALPKCEIIYTGEHGADTRSYKVSFDKFLKTFPHIKQQWPMQKSINDLIKQLQKDAFTKNDFISGKYTRLVTLNKALQDGILSDTLYWNL